MWISTTKIREKLFLQMPVECLIKASTLMLTLAQMLTLSKMPRRVNTNNSMRWLNKNTLTLYSNNNITKLCNSKWLRLEGCQTQWNFLKWKVKSWQINKSFDFLWIVKYLRLQTSLRCKANQTELIITTAIMRLSSTMVRLRMLVELKLVQAHTLTLSPSEV